MVCQISAGLHPPCQICPPIWSTWILGIFLQGGRARSKTKTQDHFHGAPSTSTRLRRLCHDGHDFLRTANQQRLRTANAVAVSTGRSAPIWVLSPCTPPGSPNGLMASNCLSTLTRLLPMQKLACSIDGTSSGISHVHGRRRLLLLWVRDYMSRQPSRKEMKQCAVHLCARCASKSTSYKA